MTDYEVIQEALSEYIENLREDDDPHNNKIAYQAELISDSLEDRFR